MPAAIPIALAVAAAGSIYQGVQANQQRQDAKGVANAQSDAMKTQITSANNASEADKMAKANQGAGTQGAALAALRASLSASSGMGGTILNGPQGAAPAPVATKTLLGI